MTKLTLLHTEI